MATQTSRLEHAFGRSSPFSLGVEEELQLLHPESFELVQRFDEIFGREESASVKPELLQSVVEVATGVAANVGEAIEEARALRRRVCSEADKAGAVVASAGTHPFSRYEHQEVTDRPRYVELMAAMQWVAARELIFGLHVHVGIGHPEQAIAVANGLRCWLPELLALSANSPFWQGFDTGLSSARSKVFDSFPRSGLPPHFASWADFEELVTRAAATNCFPDATYLWWDVRPHPKFGTIEVRVCDGQSRIESVAGLVALVQSTAAWLAEEWEGGKRRGGQPRTLVAENKWRAARYGLDCDLVDLQHDEEIPAAQAVRRLLDRVADHASRLGCAAELAEVERLLERGNGAAEQRHVYDETHSLLAVAQHLVKQTLADI